MSSNVGPGSGLVRTQRAMDRVPAGASCNVVASPTEFGWRVGTPWQGGLHLLAPAATTVSSCQPIQTEAGRHVGKDAHRGLDLPIPITCLLHRIGDTGSFASGVRAVRHPAACRTCESGGPLPVRRLDADCELALLGRGRGLGARGAGFLGMALRRTRFADIPRKQRRLVEFDIEPRVVAESDGAIEHGR